MTDALFDTTTPGPARALGAGPGATPAAVPLRDGHDTGPAGTTEQRAAVASNTGSGTAASTTPAGPVLEIHVVGVPAPQGSKRGFVVGNRPIVVDDNKATLRTWRDDVKAAALAALEQAPGYAPPADGVGVELDVTFLLPRPRGHYRTGRNAHLLRDSAPARPTTKPDADKLLRSTLDALKVAGIYRDDSHAVTITGRKHYATNHPGALIHVYVGTR